MIRFMLLPCNRCRDLILIHRYASDDTFDPALLRIVPAATRQREVLFQGAQSCEC